MTQPAKVQEPSMEEILASIRRIIADDEAKPSSGEEPASSAKAVSPERPAATAPMAKPTVMKDIAPAPAAISPAKAPTPIKPVPATPPPLARANPPAANGQKDIDALLSGLDEATSEAEIRAPLPDGEVFELTDEMALPGSSAKPQVPFQLVEPQDDIEFNETPPVGAAAHRQAQPEPPPFQAAPPPQRQILSHSTVSAVESAFNTLANTVLSNNARTLEDLVKEMLRPMLKSWLDDNLPGMVERIVKAEIERVSRGR